MRKFDFAIARPDRPTKLENAVSITISTNFVHLLITAGHMAHGGLPHSMRAQTVLGCRSTAVLSSRHGFHALDHVLHLLNTPERICQRRKEFHVVSNVVLVVYTTQQLQYHTFQDSIHLCPAPSDQPLLQHLRKHLIGPTAQMTCIIPEIGV